MLPIDVNRNGRHIVQRLVQEVERTLGIALVVWGLILDAAIVVTHNEKAQHLCFAHIDAITGHIG